MATMKVPAVRTPLSGDGIWIVPVSKALRLGCLLRACVNPACPCTELTLSVYELDQRVSGFGFKKSKLVFETAPLDDRPFDIGPPLSLTVDVYTGTVRNGADHPADERDRRIAAIADALDAEMLDSLEAFWRRQRRLASCDGQIKAGALDWEPGELLYWEQVFEVDRQETFLEGGRRVVALDMYCVNPDCNCNAAVVSFNNEILPGRAAPPTLGTVRVSFNGRVTFEPRTPESEPKLRELWARYRRRHPQVRVLRERYLKIREHALARKLYHSTPPRRIPTVSDVAPAPQNVASLPSPLVGQQRGDAPRAWVSTSRKSKHR